MCCTHLTRVLSFILTIVVVGCTKENMCDCQTEVRLQLSYEHNKNNTEHFEDLGLCGELFVYDGGGRLLKNRLLDVGEMESGEVEFSVAQEAGNYSAVVWINASCSGDYVFSGVETMSTMRLEVLHDNGLVGTLYPNWQSLGELMHGVYEFTTDGLRTPVEDTVSLRKLTNFIYVVLDGVVGETYVAGSPTSYTIQLMGSNGAYGCYANKLACQRLNYAVNYWTNYPDMRANALVGEFQTLHLIPDDDMRLLVFSGTTMLYNESLTELLRKVFDKGGININPYGDTFSEWLWRFDEYALRFDSNMTLKAIKLLDWVYLDDIDGLQYCEEATTTR